MMALPSRRAIVLAVVLAAGVTFLLLHSAFWSSSSISILPSNWTGADNLNSGETARRIARMRGKCAAENPFEKQYGRMNLRLSRGYEGSHYKLQQFIQKALRGEPVTIAALGGSITKGHHVWDTEIWFWRFYEWLQDFVGKDVELTHANGAAPAVGSDYFSFCFPLHIPRDSDLVMVELGVNDEAIPEHIGNMENLLRGLLAMEKTPAVMLVEALAFSTGGMGGGGGRMHLPVAQFYDVPVVNQRLPLANHFGRFPELIRPYFAQDYWGTPDTRHINARGHLDLGMLVAAFVQDVACTMLADPNFTVPINASAPVLPPHAVPDPEDSDKDQTLSLAESQDAELRPLQSAWPERTRSWRLDPSDTNAAGQLMPGVFNTPDEFGIMPRQKVLDGWNPSLDNVVPPFHPVCLSTRSTDPAYDLVPSSTEGWAQWVHPDFQDKPYLVATVPRSWAKFELETGLGVVKVYALKSKTFGLGNIECWVDDERDKSVEVQGWWDNGEANIGRFATIREGLSVGPHTLTCELLEKTTDPGGGHEFRLIGVMSL